MSFGIHIGIESPKDKDGTIISPVDMRRIIFEASLGSAFIRSAMMEADYTGNYIPDYLKRVRWHRQACFALPTLHSVLFLFVVGLGVFSTLARGESNEILPERITKLRPVLLRAENVFIPNRSVNIEDASVLYEGNNLSVHGMFSKRDTSASVRGIRAGIGRLRLIVEIRDFLETKLVIDPGGGFQCKSLTRIHEIDGDIWVACRGLEEFFIGGSNPCSLIDASLGASSRNANNKADCAHESEHDSKQRKTIEASIFPKLKYRNGGLTAPGEPLYFFVTCFVSPIVVGFIGLFLKKREQRYFALLFALIGLCGYATFFFLSLGILWYF